MKTLPPDQQAAVFDRLQQNTLEQVRAWLFAEWDIKTSVGALSEFHSWYGLRQRVSKESNFVDSLLDHMREDGEFALSSGKLAEFGNLLFMARAAREENPKVWAMILKLVNQREALGLDSRRVALLEKKAAQFDAAKEVMESKLSPEEQRQRLKEILK